MFAIILVAILKKELNILDKEKEKKVADTKVSDGKLYTNHKLFILVLGFIQKHEYFSYKSHGKDWSMQIAL